MENLIKIAKVLQENEISWRIESSGYLPETKLTTKHYFELEIDAEDNIILERFDREIFKTESVELMTEFLIYNVRKENDK